FIRSGGLEDAVFTLSSGYITRAANVGKGTRIRGWFTVGYSGLYNQKTLLPLEITGKEIHGISADSLLGTRKAFFRVEAVVYTPWQFLGLDRKSTRLNSSHVKISYAVFCLKKK